MAYFVWGVPVASEPIRIPGLVRFGEDFDFDFSACTLRRSGRVLKLERIPAEVLAILIERRGQIVRREHIVERIWGKDVFLDTDNSINGAIRKIRQVLKDDSEAPRFIQTVTGKGHRFIAPVTEPSSESAGPAAIPESPIPKQSGEWLRRPGLLSISMIATVVVLL